LPSFERAESLTRQGGVMPHFRGTILAGLAQTVHALGHERTRVFELIGTARAEFERARPAGAEERARFETWVASVR
jgi:hypothetical protein